MEKRLITVEQSLEIIEGEVLSPGDTLQHNPAILYYGDLTSPRSQETMKRCLDTIAWLYETGGKEVPSHANEAARRDKHKRFAWQALRHPDVMAIKNILNQLRDKGHYKAASVNLMLSALRGTLKQSWNAGYMAAEEYHRAVNFKGIKSEDDSPAGRDLKEYEFKALLSGCKDIERIGDEVLGVRDAAMLVVLYGLGLRRSEVIKLKLSDLDRETGQLVIMGKGSKKRRPFLPSVAMLYMERWLKARGDAAGPIFLPIRRGGHIQYKEVDGQMQGMTSQAIYNMLRKRGKDAGLQNFSPHDFRRTFISEMLDQVGIDTVAEIVGHVSTDTTRRYDRRKERRMFDAKDKIHIHHPDSL